MSIEVHEKPRRKTVHVVVRHKKEFRPETFRTQVLSPRMSRVAGKLKENGWMTQKFVLKGTEPYKRRKIREIRRLAKKGRFRKPRERK